jgi:hypothetical protein
MSQERSVRDVSGLYMKSLVGAPGFEPGASCAQAGIPLKTTLLFSMLPLKQNNLIVIFACGWLCASVPKCL